MVLAEFVDLSVDSNRWKMYGNTISMAQSWISDIHTNKVFIVLTICEIRKNFQLLSYGEMSWLVLGTPKKPMINLWRSYTADHGGYKFIAYPQHILPHILSLWTPNIVLQTYSDAQM